MKYTVIIVLVALLGILKLTESRASSLRALEARGASHDNGVPLVRTLQTTEGGGGEEDPHHEEGEEEHHEEGEEEHHDEEGTF